MNRERRRRRAARRERGYYRRVLALGLVLTASRGGGVFVAEVRHDDWCPRLRGGPCRCEPDIVLRDGPGLEN